MTKGVRVLLAFVVVLLGMVLGSFLMARPLIGQEAQESQGPWVYTLSKPGNGDGYLYNTRTGEMYHVSDNEKIPVKLKDK